MRATGCWGAPMGRCRADFPLDTQWNDSMATIAELVKDEALVADSYERVKADLAALAVEELAQVNFDIQLGARTILGALPELRALRERMVKELPSFDIAAFDKLEDYTQALKFAQSGFLLATQPPDDLEQLLTEGAKMKERLVADVKSLSLYGLFDSNVLSQLRGGNGLDNLAVDLDLLSQAMTASWEKIQGKALTPLADVQTASRIGLRLTRIAGLRDQGPARLAAATELRMRAFTTVVRTYDEVRHAVFYLRRREDDADSIAPSLYPGKARRKVVQPPPEVPSAQTTGGASTPSAAGTTPAAADGAHNDAAHPATPAAGSAGGPFV